MTKEQKLLNRPVDKDTEVILEDLVSFDQFPGLMELWKWDNITASSIILLQEDVKGMKENEIINFVFEKMKQPVDPQTTFKISGDYVYINFGFKVR
jgi:hypothetical protein